ncbi:MAG TPA: hypothetical protein VGF47_11610 [Solirubrobacteraceae bacterium]
MRRLFTVTVLGALLLITLRAGVADASVSFEVKGEWTCDNRGTVTPLAGARVELWRPGGISTLWIDEKLGATHTNANGAYSFSVRADDNFDLYSKVVMNDDQGVHLGNWYSFSDYDTETQTTGSHAGIVNLGNWQISHENGAGTPTCAAFQGAHNAYQNYKQLMGVAPPDSSYLINWDYPCCGVPFTLLDVTNWPGGYETGYGPKDPDGGYAVNFHEFAHSVRHSLDGGSLHFLYDAARFGYPKSHELCLLSNEGFAFNEGWAEFWAHTPATCGDGTNFNQEGNVAAALTGLEKCADRKTMVRVLALNPEAIHSYAEFKAKFFSIVGQRACVIKSIGGLQAVEKTIAAAPLLASTESQIVGETKLIASMSRRMAVVRTHAQDPGKCLKGRCVAALQTLIEPSALSTQIAQARLLRERLQSGLAAARSVINAPESAQLKLFETLDAERATFEAANQAIQIKGLQQGVAAIRAKPAFASARSTTAFRNMSQRLARLTAAHSRHVPTPTGVATFFSAPQVAGDVARRVGSR